METYLGDSGSLSYSHIYTKRRIKEHYGENIIIAGINGKPNVVTFINTHKLVVFSVVLISARSHLSTFQHDR